jgi:hypothetical protein
MFNLFSSDHNLLDSLHKRYQDVIEFYKEDKLGLPLTEILYIQGFTDGFWAALKYKEQNENKG